MIGAHLPHIRHPTRQKTSNSRWIGPLHAVIFQTWNVFIHDCSWDDIGVVSHCLPPCSLCLRLGLRVVQLTRTWYFCQDPLIKWRLPNVSNLNHCSPMQGETKGVLCTGLPQYSPQPAVGRSCLTSPQSDLRPTPLPKLNRYN